MDKEKALKEQVETKYDIDKVCFLEKVDGRNYYIVHSESGMKHFLRPIYYANALDRLQYDLSFSGYLADEGFPARRVVRTVEDRIFFAFQGSSYYLSEYIVGNTLSTTEQNSNIEHYISNAASCLGRLHLLSKKYAGPKYQKLPFHSRKSYAILNKAKSNLLQMPEIREVESICLEAINQKLEYVKKYPFEKQSYLGLENMMNHGDFHFGNILFDSSGEVKGVIDFEYCTFMPRLWDLALSITWMCGERNREAFTGKKDPAKIAIFLSAYSAIFPLDLQHQEYLNELMVSATYHSTYLIEKRYVNTGSVNLEICTSIDEWFWWALNREELSQIIRNACTTG